MTTKKLESLLDRVYLHHYRRSERYFLPQEKLLPGERVPHEAVVHGDESASLVLSREDSAQIRRMIRGQDWNRVPYPKGHPKEGLFYRGRD